MCFLACGQATKCVPLSAFASSSNKLQTATLFWNRASVITNEWPPLNTLQLQYSNNIYQKFANFFFQQLCAQTQQAWGIAKAHGGRLWKMWPSEVLVSCTQKPWFALMSKAGKDRKGDSKSLISIHHLWHKNEQNIILHICMIQLICHIGGDQPCFNIPKNTLALCSGQSHRHQCAKLKSYKVWGKLFLMISSS